MNNMTDCRPPQRLVDLEHRNSPRKNALSFGLGWLLTISNLIGLFIAVVVWTEGLAIAVVLLSGFGLPILVCVFMSLVFVFEKTTGRTIGRTLRKPRMISSPKSPFAE